MRAQTTARDGTDSEELSDAAISAWIDAGAPIAEPAHEALAEGLFDRTLADLCLRPELLVPPTPVLPHLAWAGRVTLLASQEKLGKSTLITQGVAAMRKAQDFLGQSPATGGILWLANDEPLPDLVQRFVSLGCRYETAIRAEDRPVPELQELEDKLSNHRPALLVIDTLAEFALPFVEDFYNPRAWIPLLGALRRQARTYGTSILLLHHTTRDGKRYADSRQLGAGVDVIVTMTGDPDLPETGRILEVRGRGVGHFKRKIEFTEGSYALRASTLPLSERVYRAVQNHPGISNRKLKEAVTGRATDVDSELKTLIASQLVANLGTPRSARYYSRVQAEAEGLLPAGPPMERPTTRAGGALESHIGHSGSTWEAPSERGVSPSGISSEELGSGSGTHQCFPGPTLATREALPASELPDGL